MGIKGKRTIIFIIIVLTVFMAATYLENSPPQRGGREYSLPSSFGNWQGIDVSFDRALLTSWLGTNHMVFREYRNNMTNHVVTLYAAYYTDIAASDMAHEPEVCYPGQGWSIISNKTVSMVLNGKSLRIKRMSIIKGDRQEIVYSWWQTKDQIMGENWRYHLYQIKNRLLNRSTDSLWIRVSSEYPEQESLSNKSEESLHTFCNDVLPILSYYFESRSS